MLPEVESDDETTGLEADEDDRSAGVRGVAAPTGDEWVQVGELAATNWGPLLESCSAMAEKKKSEGEQNAAHWRAPALKRAAAAAAAQGAAVAAGRQLGKRAKTSETDSDRANEEFVRARERETAQNFEEQMAAVTAVERAIVAHDEFEKAECEGLDSKVDEGVLVALFKVVLGKHGVNIQRYWNGALVGPDCRKVLENYVAILEDIGKGMVAAGFGNVEAKDFIDKHTAVLRELAVVSRITRRVNGAEVNKCLSAVERKDLKVACAAFGVAWRANYCDKAGKPRRLTIKGHIVEVHVPDFVEWFHACGVFGEDGAEALHVVDSLCRRIVRQMRNPEARHKAHTLHHLARTFTPELQREILERQSQKKKNAAAAAAAEKAAAEALIAASPALE